MIDKKSDRMPKEFKIAVYAIIMGTLYFFLYSLVFFAKFKYKPFFIPSCILAGVYAVLVAFLILKSNIARIVLAVLSAIQSLLFLVIGIALIFFKQSSVSLSRILHTGIFTFYLLLGQLGTTPDKGAVASFLISIWSGIVAYLLFHRETRRYTITKTYELVDTRKETLIAIVIMFSIIAALYFLVKF